MLLKALGLTLKYDKMEAVTDFSVEVAEGELVSIIGSNGAGKTTILRALAGVIRPAAGEIWFQGRRIDGQPAHKVVKQGIAYVPEGRRLFPQMTVMENLRSGAYLRTNRAEISADLEHVFEHFPTLRQRTSQMAGSLSGGQQQMVTIGRGLMASPKLMLLDEPSLGLAPLMVSEISKIISAIKSEGMSIILVEQNARLAMRLADKGYVLVKGKVVLSGTGEELRASSYVKEAYLGL